MRSIFFLPALSNFVIVILGLLCLSITPASEGAATVRITLTSPDPITGESTSKTLVVNDNEANDEAAEEGNIVARFVSGNWRFTTTAAGTKPLLGSRSVPVLHVTLSALSVGPGTAVVEFSDDSYGSTYSQVYTTYTAQLDRGGASSLTYVGSLSPTNEKFAGNVLVSAQTSTPGPSANDPGRKTIDQAGPYALTQTLTLVHTGAGSQVSSGDCVLAGPPVTGSIGDFVWKDVNHNGIQDAGEPGIDGVAVKLFSPGGVLLATVLTANNGFYQFPELAAGTYTVTVDPAQPALAGLLPTATTATDSTTESDSNANPATVTLATDSSSDQSTDFGFFPYVAPTGQIGDYVWMDLNQDGIQQSTEAGIGGVKVTLKNLATNLVATATTGPSGAYLFTGLEAGSYLVTVDTSSPSLTGFVPTFTRAVGSTAADDSNENPCTIVLATNSSSDRTADFGYIPTPRGSIGDFVWLDLNGDGIQGAGEPGISNATVRLYQGTTLVATTSTDVDGYYLFSLLNAGTYSVKVDTTSSSLANTTPSPSEAPDSTAANDSNANPSAVILPLNTSSNTSIDFGFVPNPTGQVGNFVWRDVNHNGIQDSGEPGINNVTVTLKDAYGSVVATTLTAGNGNYLFTGLSAGAYFVVVDGLDADLGGMIPTTVGATGSSAGNDSNANPAPVTLATDSSVNLTVDFGFFAPGCGCIGDYVWRDLDCDGVQDCSEPGIKGVTVKLYWNNILVGTDVTDSCGHYLFCGLWAGTYTVVIDGTQSVLAGLSPTKPGATSYKAYDSSTSPVTVNLATNRSCDMTIDFGFKKAQTTCPITTCSPASWLNESNYFCKYLADNFDKVYPGGLTSGSCRYLKFTTCQAVKTFLPCAGSGTYLRQCYFNPSTQLGTLAGNVICLRVAVDCSKAGVTGPGLANCKVNTGKFRGWTVAQVLNLSEICLGGSRLPYNCSYKDLSDVCALINDNYDLGRNLGRCLP